MTERTNSSQILAKVAKREQHFGIRKLTIGATSVLLGTTLWLGAEANVVHADTQNENGGATPHEETKSDQQAPEINENTKIEVQPETSSSSNIQTENNKQEQAESTFAGEQNDDQTKTSDESSNNLIQGQHVQVNNNQVLSRTDKTDEESQARVSAVTSVPEKRQVDSEQGEVKKSIPASSIQSNQVTSANNQVKKQGQVSADFSAQKDSTQNYSIETLGSAGVKSSQGQGNTIFLSLRDSKLENKLAGSNDESTQSIKQVGSWSDLVSAANDQNINDIQITQNIDATNNLQLNRSSALTIESAPTTGVESGTAAKYTLNLGTNIIDLPSSGDASLTFKNLTITGTNSKAAVQSNNRSVSAHYENVDVQGTPLFNGKGNVYVDGQVSSNVYGIAHSTDDDIKQQFLSVYKVGISSSNWYNANILADNVFVDPNAHLTISRDLTGDGIIVEGGLADGTGDKKFGSVTLSDKAQLDIILKNGHDLDASTEKASDIDNANTAIYAPQNGQFKTGTNAVVTIYAGHGRGVIFDEPAGGTSSVQSEKMVEWARDCSSISGTKEANAQNNFELGDYSKFNLHSRDGVLLGNDATLNTGEHSILNFDNHGNGIGLQLDAKANVEIGPYTNFKLISDGKNNSGGINGGDYIVLGDNAQFTVDHDADFKYKEINATKETSWLYAGIFNIVSPSKNSTPTIKVEKNAIFDGESDCKTVYAEILSFGLATSGDANQKATINIDGARYFNLQRNIISGNGAIGNLRNPDVQGKRAGNLFFSEIPCTLNVYGNNYNFYKWSDEDISDNNFDASDSQNLKKSVQELDNTSNEYWQNIKNMILSTGKRYVNYELANTSNTIPGVKQKWAFNDSNNGFETQHSQRIAIVDSKWPQGRVNVVFHDSTTGQNITGYGPKTPLIGDENTAVTGYSPDTDISTLKNLGYVRDTTTPIPTGDLSDMPTKYTDGNQTVYINMKHKVTPVTADTPISNVPSNTPNWARPDQLKKTVARSVTYENNDGTRFTGTVPKNASETLEFDGTAYVDVVNGHVVTVKSTTPGNYEIDNDANNQNNINWVAKNGTSFSAVTSPVETGYHVASVSDHTDGNNVAAIDDINKDSQNIAISVKYDKDAAETAQLKIVDDTTGQTLNNSINASGDENTPISFTDGQSIIDGYLDAGYRFVSVINDNNNTVLADGSKNQSYVDAHFGNFDTNPNVEQNFTVHLAHKIDTINGDNPYGIKATASVTRQINYAVDGKPDSDLPSHTQTANFKATGYYDEVTKKIVDENGNAGSLIWTTDNSNQDSSIFNGYAVPAKNGYYVNNVTVDPATNKSANVDDTGLVHELTVNHDSHNITVTINLTRNQVAQVIYRDINDSQNVITLDTDTGLMGKTGDAIKDDRVPTKIQDFENQGYVLVDNGLSGAAFDNVEDNIQTVDVDFKHDTVTINPNNPGEPGQPINSNDPNGPKWGEDTDTNHLQVNGSQTIRYTGAGSNTPKDNVQNTTFNREEVIDKVTGKVVADHGWTPSSHTFSQVTTPTITGYSANVASAGGATVTPNDPDATIEVTYKAEPAHPQEPDQPTQPTTAPSQQNANIRVIDEDNNNSQLTSGNASGNAGTAIDFANICNTVQNYLNNGYKWDYASAGNNRLSAKNCAEINFGNFDTDDSTTQNWTIYLKHNIAFVDAAHPGNGYTANQLQHTVTTNVSYVDQDGKEIAGLVPIHESVTFNGSGHYDQVTHNWVNVDANGNIAGQAQGPIWTYSINGGPTQNGDQATLPAIAAKTATGYSFSRVESSKDPNLSVNSTDGSIASQTVNRQTANSNVVVHFVRNIGSVIVTFRDDDLGLSIPNVGYNSGSQTVGTQIFYDPSANQSNLENQGYVYVRTDGTLPTAVSQGRTAIVIHMRHAQKDVSATDPQAEKTIKRTIIVTNPNGSHNDLSQILRLHRSALQDAVTKQVTYGDWNEGSFAAVTIPTIAGYNASQNIVPAVAHVTADFIDPHIQVSYTSTSGNQGTEVINYIDSTGKQVGSQILHGRIGSTRNFALNVPDGYDAGTNQSIQNDSLQVRFEDQTPVTNNILVTDHLVRIDPDKLSMAEPILGIVKHPETATLLPGTKGRHANDDLTYGDLHKEITRGIIIINPDGSLNKSSIAQTVVFKRWATINAVTGKITFDDWQPVGKDSFDEVAVPTIASYTPTQGTVAAVDNVPSDYAVKPIVVRYNGDPATQTIAYRGQNGQLISTQTIKGHVGDDLALRLVIPDGYQLIPSERVRKQVQLSQNNKAIDVMLQPIMVKVDPDEVTVNKPISSKTVISGTTNKHLAHDITYQDLHKDVTRTVTIKQPDGTIDPHSCTQTVHFTRTAIINGATGTVTYSQWVPESTDSLAPVVVPPVAGYTASTQVAAVSTVANNYKDPQIVVTYMPNEQKQTVVFQDEQGHILGQQIITGKTDQTVKINPQAPDGYKVDSNSQAPTQVKMTVNSKPITITVAPKQTVIKAKDVTPTKSISTSDVIPGTVTKHPDHNITYQDLNKDVQRLVIMTLPNGQQKNIVQTVHFERQAHIDDASGKVTFGNWTAQDGDNFAKVNPPTIAGYIPTNVASEIDGLSDTDNSQTVKINYLPDTVANRLQIAKNSLKDLQQARNNSAKKLAALQNVAARAGQASQAAQTAYQKQQTLVKNLAQKASDLQKLVKDTKTADEEAKERAEAAQKRVNQLKDKLQDLKSQKQAEQNKLNAENAGLKSDQYNAGQINNDLNAINAKLEALKKDIAQAQSVLDMEKNYVHATLNLSKLSNDYIRAVKDFQSGCDQLYKRVYDQNVADGNEVNAEIIASNTINSDDPRMVAIRNNFFNAVKKAGYELLTSLSKMPEYHFGSIWNKADAQEKVNLKHLTDQQKNEINNYTFALINNIRGQLSLKPLLRSTMTQHFADEVAQDYDNFKRSIFNTGTHADGVINYWAGKLKLRNIPMDKEAIGGNQQYEDIAPWYSDADVVIVPDKNGTIKVMFYPGDENDYHSSASQIKEGQTNMDSIKQGIFGNMLQMLMEDATSNWGHTVSLLNLGAMKDYKDGNNAKYFLGTSISKLQSAPPEKKEILNLGGYTDHFIDVASSDLLLGSTVKANDNTKPITAPTDAQVKAAEKALASDKAQSNQYQQQADNKQNQLAQINVDIGQRQGRINTIQSRIADLSNQINQTSTDLQSAEGIQSGTASDKTQKDAKLKDNEAALQETAEKSQKEGTILDSLKDKAFKAVLQATDANREVDKLNNRVQQNQVQIGTTKKEPVYDQSSSTKDGQQKGDSQSGSEPSTTDQGTVNAGASTGSAQNSANNQMGTTQSDAPTPATQNNAATPSSISSPSKSDSGTDEDNDSNLGDESGYGRSSKNNRGGASAGSNASGMLAGRRRARRAEINNSPMAMKGIRREGRQNGPVKAEYVRIASAGQLGFRDSNQNDQNVLPQTGEGADSITAALAGGAAVSIALIGLAGVRKRKVRYLR